MAFDSMSAKRMICTEDAENIALYTFQSKAINPPLQRALGV